MYKGSCLVWRIVPASEAPQPCFSCFWFDVTDRASLNLGKNNSTAAETDGNDRYDCRDVYQSFEFENVAGDTAEYRCGSWDCYCCGYRMRQNLVEEIQRITTA